MGWDAEDAEMLVRLPAELELMHAVARKTGRWAFVRGLLGPEKGEGGCGGMGIRFGKMDETA
jgi:hypothetical protein